MINYSIIVPHRGGVHLLFRLLKSIPNRSDIEVLVVDNSLIPLSKDNFPEDLSRITLLFSDSTKGAGHARNIGLSSSRGKWIVFADSDDYFTELAFDKMDLYLESRFDIVYFNVLAVNSDTLLSSNRAVIYEKLIQDYIDRKSDDNLENIRFKYLVPWGKMFSSTFLKQNNIVFDEVEASNDIMFSLRSGHLAKSIFVDSSRVYCVTENLYSLTSNDSKSRNRSRYLVALNHNKYLRDNNYSKFEVSVLVYYKRSLFFGLSDLFYFIGVLKYYKGERIFVNWIKNKL